VSPSLSSYQNNRLESIRPDRLNIAISPKDGAPMADNAKIVMTDIACSDGGIHVTDAVILPK
jgi:uncharacterized surface protein with fasciclin (FAS1) repeats